MVFGFKPILFILLYLNIFFIVFTVSPSSSLSDAEILLRLRDSLANNAGLASWNINTPPCKGDSANWNGVLCAKNSIWGLNLENMGLTGNIDVNLLAELKNLRMLSFVNNNFKGPLPDFKKLSALKAIYLSNNHFSGDIPADAFQSMMSLKKLHLSNNEFTGPIPDSLAKVPKLIELKLDNNKFDGKIPDLDQKELQILNLSNNKLEGPIPPGLKRFGEAMFEGNKDLCGGSLAACDASKKDPTPESPKDDKDKEKDKNNEKDNDKDKDKDNDKDKPPQDSAPTDSNKSPDPKPDPSSDQNQKQDQNQNQNSSPSSEKSSSSVGIVVGSVVGGLALAFIIPAIFIIRRRQQRAQSIEAPLPPSNLQKKSGIKESEASPQQDQVASAAVANGGGAKSDAMKLTFVRDDRQRFDLQDLLKASAEILGSGCFGSSYKAALLTGTVTMVVKRFKQMNNVGREEFQEHMRRIGRLRHPNLLPLVAYYYRKEEKLLITDFIERGSLAVHLHGHAAVGQPSLDWPTRLKIVKGVAKGLSYLYKELPSLIAPHGHLKSSNVLLTESFEPLLTDYGLIPVINQESAQDLMVAYKSPEFYQHGRITKKTDVWGLGMLIFEILTGKFPANFLQQGKRTDEDLASWVQSAIEAGTDSRSTIEVVFDKDMGGTKNSEGEMMKLLKIGLGCCEAELEKRFDLKEAVEKIEDIKERDGDDDFYSSYASEADMKSSRGMSGDFILS